MTEPVAASPPTPSDTLRAAAPDLARRFGLTLGGLCTAIGLSLRGASPAGKALAEQAWKRIFQVRGRLDALLARVAAGWLPRPRTATPRAAPVAPPDATASPRAHVGPPPLGRLPRGRGCVVRVVGYQAAGYASQLEYLLADPAMAELVANVPAVGRMLRPLCRALGISPPVLGFPPPPPPRQVRPKRETPSMLSRVYATLAAIPDPAPDPAPVGWPPGVRRRWVLPGSA